MKMTLKQSAKSMRSKKANERDKYHARLLTLKEYKYIISKEY